MRLLVLVISRLFVVMFYMLMFCLKNVLRWLVVMFVRLSVVVFGWCRFV